MKISETILLGFFAVFAGVLLFNSLEMPYFSGQGFGVGFLPLNMSVAVIVLTGVITLRALLRRKRNLSDPCKERKESPQAGIPGKKNSFVAPISTIGLLVAATLLMGFGSILLPLAILMTIVSALFLDNTWLRSVRMTVVTLGVIFLIFSVWLGIPLT